MMNNDELLEQMNRSKIVMVDVDKLLPYARNAKLHTDEQVDELVALMREVGYTQPILLDGGFEIIAGHGRLLALKKMGMKKAPCIPLPHLTEAQKKAYRLADNQQVMKTGWDMELLKIELNDLNGLNFDIGMIGFDDNFLDQLLTTEPEETEPEKSDSGTGDDIDNISKIVAKERVKLGDFWQLGRHLLVCGDSGNKDLVHRAIGLESADCMVTDPPYGLSFMGKDWDKGVPSQQLWEVWHSRLKPGAHVLSFSGTRTYHLMTVAIENSGFEIRDMMQWIYGQGFPKSHDISKAIDNQAGIEREREAPQSRKNASVAIQSGGGFGSDGWAPQVKDPVSDEDKRWNGWGTALKPAQEIICYATKPHDARSFAGQSAHFIRELLCQYLSSVNVAEKNSASSQRESGAVQSDSVPWNAVARCNTLADLLAAMDTLLSDQDQNSFLSTAKSWLITLAEICDLMSMSTIETVSRTIIAWKTLNCLLSQITPESMAGEGMNQNGKPSPAEIVGSYFRDLKTYFAITQGHSAIGPAILQEAQNSPVAIAKTNSCPAVLAQKPISEKTIAANVLKHGTGGLNIDGTRIAAVDAAKYAANSNRDNVKSHWDNSEGGASVEAHALGRFPSNVIFDESAAAVLDEQSGITKGSGKPVINQDHEHYEGVHAGYGEGMFSKKIPGQVRSMGDSGGASRFFYVAKPSSSERDPENDHATVKPISLMQYLVRLVCQPDGLVLEPFAGSGTTLLACEREGMNCIGFELDPHHCDIILARWEKLTGKTAEKIS